MLRRKIRSLPRPTEVSWNEQSDLSDNILALMLLRNMGLLVRRNILCIAWWITTPQDHTAFSTFLVFLLHSPIGQVALSVPATELTSVSVQWGAGDPASGTDQNAVPLALSIEASVDGGQVWQGITGGGEAVDVALAHKASLGSSQHRYPVSLLGLRRKRRV